MVKRVGQWRRKLRPDLARNKPLAQAFVAGADAYIANALSQRVRGLSFSMTISLRCEVRL